MDPIKAIERNQAQIIDLLHEYQHAKQFERMKTEFKTVYIIQDGFLLDHTGKLLVDSCNWYFTARINSYLRKGVPPGDGRQVHDFGNMVADVYTRPSHIFEDEINSNSKLIARAPDLLRTICRTYLLLLIKFSMHNANSTVGEIRIGLDGTLSSLRNEISEATGLECQHIQDTFEGYADKINGGEEIPAN